MYTTGGERGRGFFGGEIKFFGKGQGEFTEIFDRRNGGC